MSAHKRVFIELMDEFHQDTEFNRKHELLANYFDTYTDKIYKKAIDEALNFPMWNWESLIIQRTCRSLETWMRYPMVAQHGIDLNVKRLLFQRITGMKLAEAWELWKSQPQE